MEEENAERSEANITFRRSQRSAGHASHGHAPPSAVGEAQDRHAIIPSLETARAFAVPVLAVPRTIVPTSRTLLLVPLLAFDASGRRLGSGRGFYDRYLKTFPGTSVGVAYAVQEVEAVPVEAHDVALGVVVTEEGWRTAVSIGPN